MLIEEIFKKFKKEAAEGNIRENKGTRSCFLIFRKKKTNEIIEHLETILKNKNGEKIICEIKKGEIYDLGKVYFKIKSGTVIEFYDYEKLSSCFIRIYEIQKKESSDSWTALYIDENPSTPWWSKEERGQ